MRLKINQNTINKMNKKHLYLNQQVFFELGKIRKKINSFEFNNSSLSKYFYALYNYYLLSMKKSQ